MLSSFSVNDSVISQACLHNVKGKIKNIWFFISFLKEVDKKIKQLKENCDELCKEVIQRKAEIIAIKEDVSSKQKLMLTDKKEVEKLLEKQANLKVTQN